MADEVPIGHRVADHGDLLSPLRKELGHPARGLGFSGPGADGAHRDNRLFPHELGGAGAQQPEVRPGCGDPGRPLHYVLVGNVGVGEYHAVHRPVPHEVGEPVLRLDRDPAWVEPAREFGGIAAAHDPRDLGGRERDHLVGVVILERDVEIVEVPAGSAHDDDLDLAHGFTSVVGCVAGGLYPATRRWPLQSVRVPFPG